MAETWSLRDLMEAGWSKADLDWEDLAERCAQSLADGDPDGARAAAGGALALARDHFADNDPRLGTALANQAVCLAARNRENAGALLREARTVWRRSGPWIEAMTAPRSARSSLFHLRMEMRHRETFEENWRVKWRQMADEAVTRLDDPAALAPADPPGSGLEAWHRERPAMLNDTRKLMAAVRLLLVAWRTNSNTP